MYMYIQMHLLGLLSTEIKGRCLQLTGFTTKKYAIKQTFSFQEKLKAVSKFYESLG